MSEPSRTGRAAKAMPAHGRCQGWRLAAEGQGSVSAGLSTVVGAGKSLPSRLSLVCRDPSQARPPPQPWDKWIPQPTKWDSSECGHSPPLVGPGTRAEPLWFPAQAPATPSVGSRGQAASARLRAGTAGGSACKAWLDRGQRHSGHQRSPPHNPSWEPPPTSELTEEPDPGCQNEKGTGHQTGHGDGRGCFMRARALLRAGPGRAGHPRPRGP